MELERQTSERVGDCVESDTQTDEYDTDSNCELLPVIDHEDETIFLHAATTRSGRTVNLKLHQNSLGSIPNEYIISIFT